MFSSRLNWNLPSNRLAQLLEEKRRSGGPLLDLTESNPTHAGIIYPEKEILEALSQPASLRYDPIPAGLLSAREAIAAAYERNGIRVEPSRILLTASTSEAYGYLFKLLADPGGEVLIPQPSYPLFEFLGAFESVKTVSYPLRYHGRWSLDLDALTARISPRSRAIVLVNPNNPTGSFVKQDEMKVLSALCAGRNLALISDEVFSDYGFAPDKTRAAALADAGEALSFSLGGLSKLSGLPQMKLGWIAMAGPAALQEAARHRLELIADSYLSVGTPVQIALPQLLSLGERVRDQIRERVQSNYAHVRSAVQSSSPCSVLHVEGGWYAILRVPHTRMEEQWCLELLKKDTVLVQPGYFYDFETGAYLVVSLLTPSGPFSDGIARLLARVDTG